MCGPSLFEKPNTHGQHGSNIIYRLWWSVKIHWLEILTRCAFDQLRYSRQQCLLIKTHKTSNWMCCILFMLVLRDGNCKEKTHRSSLLSSLRRGTSVVQKSHQILINLASTFAAQPWPLTPLRNQPASHMSLAIYSLCAIRVTVLHSMKYTEGPQL